MSSKIERGDFQTPFDWAARLTQLLRSILSESPSLIIEPTCGVGAFAHAACSIFPSARVFGFDINRNYARIAKQELSRFSNVQIFNKDFFHGDYSHPLSEKSGHVLFLGNPPWVTNSKLGVLGSDNLPEKYNSESLRGIEAITGKSNFDISEWMIARMLDSIQERCGTVAMICKSSVARKIVHYAATKNLKFSGGRFFSLNSKKVFDVSVDCGFFVFHTFGPTAYQVELQDLNFRTLGKFGNRDGQMISDISNYDQFSFLEGDYIEKWRSGLKHDCSAVFEFAQIGRDLVNGNGEIVAIERDYLYPFLKSSDLANNRIHRGDRFVLVTQTRVGQDTQSIASKAPKTWAYLSDHQALISSRKSAIYKNKPDFSIFGIGPYSFTPWKIAISGLYKTLNFVKIGPQNGKTIMLDDTCYFLPCENEENADFLLRQLQSKPAQSFLNSIIFWDAKRPINADILQRLNLSALLQD